ncbi:partial D-inositol 3-phosphate glycosyltransferase, partial [Patescibacteria group bacterium]
TGFPAEKNLLDAQRFDEYEFEGLRVHRFYHAYAPMGGQTSIMEVGYNNQLVNRYFQKILYEFEPDIVHFFHLSRLGTGLIDEVVERKIPAFMTPTDFWVCCTTAQLTLCNGQLCLGPSQYSGNCVKHFVQNTHKGLLGKIIPYMPTEIMDSLVNLTVKGKLPFYKQQHEVIATAKRLPFNISRLNKLKAIISPTHLMTRQLLAYGVEKERIIQSAFGIDVPMADSSRSEPSLPLRIGFIGTLGKHKGCHVLIKAVQSLPAEQIKLAIYGNDTDFPDYAEQLKQSAQTSDNIEFRGTFPNAQISDVFAGLDVLVVPSLWYENTPLVVYSAQAAHCPVIASDFEGFADVITHEDNGLLFEAGNVTALTEQLSRLIHAPDLLKKLSEKARLPKSTVTYVNELLTIWQQHLPSDVH